MESDEYKKIMYYSMRSFLHFIHQSEEKIICTPENNKEFNLDLLIEEMNIPEEEQQKIRENKYRSNSWLLKYFHEVCPRPFLIISNEREWYSNNGFLVGTAEDVFLSFTREVNRSYDSLHPHFKPDEPTLPQVNIRLNLNFYLGHNKCSEKDLDHIHGGNYGGGASINYKFGGLSIDNNLDVFFKCLETVSELRPYYLSEEFGSINMIPAGESVTTSLLRECALCAKMLKEWKMDENGLVLPEEYPQYYDFRQKINAFGGR